jgi:hypothetical protein
VHQKTIDRKYAILKGWFVCIFGDPVCAVSYCVNKEGQVTKKMPPIKDEGNLMFSQRNNPYCELLRIDCKYSVFSDLNLISW